MNLKDWNSFLGMFIAAMTYFIFVAHEINESFLLQFPLFMTLNWCDCN